MRGMLLGGVVSAAVAGGLWAAFADAPRVQAPPRTLPATVVSFAEPPLARRPADPAVVPAGYAAPR